jgi:hypothetical protein
VFILKKFVVQTAVMYRDSKTQEDMLVDLPLQAVKDYSGYMTDENVTKI